MLFSHTKEWHTVNCSKIEDIGLSEINQAQKDKYSYAKLKSWFHRNREWNSVTRA
jgi:uncharacterized protein YydD (DUF2326 family)